MMNQDANLRGICKMKFNIKLSDTEITSLVNFIEHWNVVARSLQDDEQADQDLLDNVARKLDQTIIKHREKVIKAQSKRPKEEW